MNLFPAWCKMLSKCVIVLVSLSIVESARILVVVPFPSISHQVVFRPLIQELVKSDHDVTFMTTDPVYKQGAAPSNLREIDLHDLSYKLWREVVLELTKTDLNNLTKMKIAFQKVAEIFMAQLEDTSIRKLINDKTLKFDLMILEAAVPITLILSHIFKAPVIVMSTNGPFPGNMEAIGAPSHPLLYPGDFHKNLYNHTVWEKLSELYFDVAFDILFSNQAVVDDKMLKSVFGMDTPPLKELEKNVHMLFLNVHHFWSHNRPVPLNVIHTWGIHKPSHKTLPQELQSYLDSSKHGVIYVSFGTNFKPSEMPPETLKVFVQVFSRLPHNILWKWDSNELPGKSENIKISKWFPQYDILRHPNVKLIITHGGLQSTDEAINAGVPLIGLPQFADQDFNAEQITYFGIGIKLDYKSLTIEKLDTAIKSMLTNYQSYKKNIIDLRTQMQDQPRSAMDNTMRWIQYTLRHGGLDHLRAPASNMSWIQYYEVELVLLILTGLAILATILLFIVQNCLMRIFQLVKLKMKPKVCNKSK